MKRKILFESDTSRLAEVRAEARSFLAESGVDECEAEMLVLAIDEACTNIIRYAYAHERKPVDLEMERLNDRVRFELRDYGRSCDPAKIKSRALEDIRPGGVGVHIIRHVFDHVEYQPCPLGTKLVLEKMLHPSPRNGESTGTNGKS
jgi:anti-sigma regulatory factor (Ser/Thr protein kinase)